MPTYRVVKGKFGWRVDGQTVRCVPGVEVDLTPKDAEALGDRVEPVKARAPKKSV